MSLPDPAGLLVEHPVLPVPVVKGTKCQPDSCDGEVATFTSLSRSERAAVGAQLMAAVALLAEFDLWLARPAFGSLRVVRTDQGVRVGIQRWPRSLSRVIEALGGGEGAIDRVRDEALRRVASATGLDRMELEPSADELGLSFDTSIARQLARIRPAVEIATARSLWAVRWDGLPDPEIGVVHLWHVPLMETAMRLASALWARLRRHRRQAWVTYASEAWWDRRDFPVLSGTGTLIAVGELGQDNLKAVSRWVEQDGCSAVAVGTFPRGWQARAPSVGRGQMAHHLGVAGLPVGSAQRFVADRSRHFEVLSSAARGGVTDAIRSLLTTGTERHAERDRTRSNAVLSWLQLSPQGLPAGFLAVHSGLSDEILRSAAASLDAIYDDGWWRLPSSEPLQRDSRHGLVADLFPPASPHHHLHAALGGGSTQPLLKWANGSLDSLQPTAVRELLGSVLPGSLGHEAELLHAEACLSSLDLWGARTALGGAPEELTAGHRRWLEALDPEPRKRPDLPTSDEQDRTPRVAIEVAMLALVTASRQRDEGATTAAREIVLRGVHKLSDLRRRRAEIDLVFADEPQRLDEASWRCQLAGRETVLRVQVAHRRALAHLDGGRYRTARRLLEALLEEAVGPGLRGAFEVDLGAIALAEGRSREGVHHHLRGYHLLRTAGFSNRTRLPLFNLAVADVDQLRIREAEERLTELLDQDRDDPFVAGERARLALARGDEPVFRQRLSQFARAVEPEDVRFEEGLALLRGAEAVLRGAFDQARELLAGAGHEGLAWVALAEAGAGHENRAVDDDDWGVARAAAIVNSGSVAEEFPVRPSWRGESVRDALALALAERVRGTRLEVSAADREAAVRTLRARGLDGWADSCEGVGTHLRQVMTALGRIVERGTPEGGEASGADAIVAGLGLSGLEIREAPTEELIWRHGVGEPGPDLRYGRFLVRPLGGTLTEGPLRHLVLGVFDLVLPRALGGREDGDDETGFLGRSEGAKAVRRDLVQLGPSHLPILVLGETGVGKEVAARALHRLSGRRGSFVAVNVAAIPATLLEAELFGSTRGAFTGAERSRVGLAVAADGGTLFLDEIGDLDSELQVKLLRFIESGVVRSVGSHRERSVNVRIVSATHQDLGRLMREGRFRRDLYYRIAAPEIVIPPLRSRTEDIPLFKEVFEREASARYGLQRSSWSLEAEQSLVAYHWPGNVRELRQVVEVALVRAAGAVVRLDHLPIENQASFQPGTWEAAQREFRRQFLIAALRRNRGNRSATAREIGISRQALLYHLRQLGLQDLEPHH